MRPYKSGMDLPPEMTDSGEDALGEGYLIYARSGPYEQYVDQPRLRLIKFHLPNFTLYLPIPCYPMTDPVTGVVYTVTAKRGHWYICNKLFCIGKTVDKDLLWKQDRAPVFIHFLKMRHYLRGVWGRVAPDYQLCSKTLSIPDLCEAKGIDFKDLFKELRSFYDRTGLLTVKPEDNVYKLPDWHMNLPTQVLVDDLSDESVSPERVKEIQDSIMKDVEPLKLNNTWSREVFTEEIKQWDLATEEDFQALLDKLPDEHSTPPEEE